MNFLRNYPAMGYTLSTSKEVRDWRPVASAAKAASDSSHAAFCFVAPFMVAQTGSRKTRRFRSAGARYANLFGLPPRLASWEAVNTTAPMEAIMAELSTSASAQITPFTFGTHAVRVIVRDGSPWFVASDVCTALEYSNASDAVATHLDDDERMTIANGESHSGKRGGARLMTIINESGLYALVLRSRKPEARKFAKWVTSEVLPAIRKTGAYVAPQAQPAHTGGVRLSELISAGNGIYIDTEELHRIAAACMEKLANRAKFYQAREMASRATGKAVSMSI